MNVTKVSLEKTSTHLQLKVYSPDTLKGYTVTESVPFANGSSPKPETLATLRKHGAQKAKRLGVKFEDATL